MFSAFRPCRLGAVWAPCLAHGSAERGLISLKNGVKGEGHPTVGREIPQEE